MQFGLERRTVLLEKVRSVRLTELTEVSRLTALMWW